VKTIKDITSGVDIIVSSGLRAEMPITGVHFDSRQIQKGYVFVAVKGTKVDGHSYIPAALENGAIAIICQDLPERLDLERTYIKVNDSAQALGIVASNFYGNPSSKLKLVGITGTNGKTTCVTLLFELFRRAGYGVGMLSTIENRINDQVLPSYLTTPDAIATNEVLADMVKKGCTHAFMEVSSHALEQGRVSGLQFDGGVFTNISHDHLDYHKSFPAYIQAKKRMFDDLPDEAFALYNADDKRGSVMVQNTLAKKKSFSLKSMSDYKGRIVDNTFDGLHLEVNGQEGWYLLSGEFNAYNITTTLAVAEMLGEDLEQSMQLLSTVRAAKGRFEQLVDAVGMRAIIDYAHTPDALKNVLETIREIRGGNQRIITVVGCGGDRDKAKRPEMGRIAGDLSDAAFFTADNPRFEAPEEIIEDMKAGISPIDWKKIRFELDRATAIQLAVEEAQPNDVILIAGKGHEEYQEVKGERTFFSDKEEVLKLFAN
jgi:UDP-N-acetylmuramoyl-L-alanyl-D-glutamate--2,6-diaminopimelate ligase